MQRYEYKFVHLDRSKWLGAPPTEETFHREILQHAAEGWRFIQIFTPGSTGAGGAGYFELIFERPVDR